ncbi:trigger factor [uncultured Gemmiger sp.]|uniref:trigger factor n=1 Tax=uncultured Gemmiger sp. TaxID=1623490 RepID=UPI0025FFEA21|nr:trigger factor [uncultured Gemmiger sp.]
MKRNIILQAGALALAVAMTAMLAGCSSQETSSSTTPENAASTGETATGETADPYAYLADFSYSDGFDDNGYLKDVTAGDYVTLPDDYNAIQLPAGTDTVTDEEVDSYIDQNVLASFATPEQVTDRAAEMGDSVNIDFVGSVDGEEFDGGSAQGYNITLGSGSFIDDFEDQIAGHTPGETFDVTVTFPDPYQNNPDLAGKEAVFVTTLNYITVQTTPDLTDTWVQENINPFLQLTSVQALKDYVREQITYTNMSNAIYSQLLDTTTFAEFPESATSYFSDYILYDYYQYAATYGLSLDSMLSSMGYVDADTLLQQAQSTIENNCRQALLVQAIAEKEGIVVDDATYDANVARVLRTDQVQGYEDAYGKNYLRANVLMTLVMDQLVDNATVAAE